MNLGDVRSTQGEHEAALAHYDEALALRRQLGDPLLIANATYNLGVAAFRAGDLDRARQTVGESLALARPLGEDLHIAAALFTLAEIDLLEGDPERAGPAIQESLAIYTDLENDIARAGCFVVLAGVALARGSHEEAARLIGAADDLRGDSQLDWHQRMLLERLEPELETGLGADRFAALRSEGRSLGGKVGPEVVFSASSS
jgi:ATP/maltotriose-dependent transcriptional regulator MalT